ncbi:MAG: peptide chain release factor N(5)-glutamine methyltransferase [Cytophagales bacterium]
MQSNLIYAELLKKVKNYSDNELKNISLKYLYLKFNLSNSDLLINKKVPWNKKIQEEFKIDIKKLTNKIPVQHITGSEFFYDRVFHVSDKTLIPRPETEELVDIIIKSEKSNFKKSILDIGTGSGCIAVTLSNHLTSNVIGIDVSKAAIDVAIKNNTLTSNKVSFITSKIEDYIPEESFDLIVSNPPYIPKLDEDKVDKNVLIYEPHNALFVDSDPIYFYKIILEFSKKHLKKNGIIYFEINQNYVELIKNLLKETNFEVVKDFYGNKRFVIVKGINK